MTADAGRSVKKEMQRKIFRFLALTALVLTAFVTADDLPAIPAPTVEFGDFIGEIRAAKWKGRIEYDERVFDQEGLPLNRKVFVPPHWIVVLIDVEGVTKKEILRINGLTASMVPKDVMIEVWKEDDSKLIMWINGPRDLAIRKGRKVQVVGLEYFGVSATRRATKVREFKVLD